MLSAVELEGYGIVIGLLNLIRNGANIISLAMATAIITATMGSMGFEPSFEAVRSAGSSGVANAFSVGLRNGFLTMMGLVIIAMAISSFQAQKPSPVEETAPERAGQPAD